MDYVLVSTTVESESDARALAEAVVAARLAACVQTTAIHSLYWWRGKVERDPEVLLFMKTRRSLAERLMAFVRERHAYEVPELTVMPIVSGSPDYLKWIEDETEAGDDG